MIFKIAWRELKQNIFLFVSLFFVVLLSVVALYIGSRILTSISLLKGEMGVYRDVLKIEGSFLMISSALLCFSLLIAAYHALPTPFRDNLEILRGQSVGEGALFLLFFLQLMLFCLPALLMGIVAGEILAKFSLPFFIRLEIPLASPFHGIYLTVLSVLLIMLLTSFFAGRYYFLGGKRRKERLAVGVVAENKIRLSVSGKFPVSLELGFLHFLRKRRPLASLLALALTAVFLIAYAGFMRYGTFLTEDFSKCRYDVEASVPGENRAAFEQILEMVENYPHASQRIYSVSASHGRTLLNDYNLQVRVLADEDFGEMASSLSCFPATEGIPAILQNFGYGEHNKPYYCVEDTSESIRGNLSAGLNIEIVGFLNEVPLEYETKDTASGATLFVKESQFPYYGDMDVYRVWFSGETEGENERLKEDIQTIGGVTLRNLDDGIGDELKIPIQFITSSSLLFLPLMIFTMILFFVRDYSSRREETEALSHMGMGKRMRFCYLLTDLILLVSAIFVGIFSLSAVVLKILHFLTIGYYAPFFIPWEGPVFLAVGLILCSMIYSIFQLSIVR